MTRFRPVFFHAAASLLAALAMAVAGAAWAQNAAPVADESRIIRISASTGAAPHHLSLALNKAAVIELDRDARDVFVANPLIADAVVRTPRRIFVMSLKIGQTNAIFLDAQGRQIATVEIVVGSDVSDLNDLRNGGIGIAMCRKHLTRCCKQVCAYASTAPRDTARDSPWARPGGTRLR